MYRDETRMGQLVSAHRLEEELGLPHGYMREFAALGFVKSYHLQNLKHPRYRRGEVYTAIDNMGGKNEAV